VLGATGSGKSSFINTASGSSLPVGEGLKSCTKTFQPGKPIMMGGRRVNLIDTPGFDDSTVRETEVLMNTAAFIVSLYKQGKTLTGVIYLHRISDVRVGGTSRKNFNLFKKIVGDEYLKNVAIVTTMWKDVVERTGAIHEKELKGDSLFYQPVLAKGGRMFRYRDDRKSAQVPINYLAKKAAAPVRMQRELDVERKSVKQTDVGIELQRELTFLGQKLEQDLKDVQKDLAGAVDTNARMELDEVRRDLERKINGLRQGDGQLEHDWIEARAAAEKSLAASGLVSQNGSASDHGETPPALRYVADSGSEAHKAGCCIVM
ncbi:hypothetical protein BC835DRAFT_1271182, partial [Cytidiella melzeri]